MQGNAEKFMAAIFSHVVNVQRAGGGPDGKTSSSFYQPE